jgi:hypothetical protein
MDQLALGQPSEGERVLSLLNTNLAILVDILFSYQYE